MRESSLHPISGEQQSNLEYNYKTILERAANAAIKSGRRPQDVKLMAVTKTVPAAVINCAIELGVNLIGENRVQEFLSKEQELQLEGCQAHIIGHLQTNKVRQIVGKVQMIQSLDSEKLAAEINLRSKQAGIITDTLIEVNIGDEDSKSGIHQSNLCNLLENIAIFDSIRVKGLMCIPPISANSEENRKNFYNLHKLFVDISGKNMDNSNIEMLYLSMGMSSDYEDAILEGSNIIRVGSALFGPRLYA
ncbi:MAG: YggS family pyridoxal phosphate-dependent enzyme [Oscillospiraceae bacterium]|jgi:pyridoxal phosphate enzyme (YggS family)|nr:YggS family pyridoxal phosphate-dependent enzyme [Oscillospiraceae bacterium]